MDSANVIDANYARILVKPRATIREIVDRDPRDRVIPLVVVSGFIGALSAAIQMRSPQAFTIGAKAIPVIAPSTLWKFRVAQVIASPILAVAFLYLNGAILRWSGALLGGSAKAVEVRAALGWSQVPSIAIGVLMIGLALMFPPPAPSGNPHAVIAALTRDLPRLAITMSLGLYAFVISLICIAEVHRFSAWRALGALAIQWLLLMGAFLVLAVTLPLVAMFLFR